MEALEKILAWIKSIIIDWRIGVVGLVGFITSFIITKNMNFIIGVTITASIIIVDIIDKNYNKWHEKHLKKKLQNVLSNPKYQQKFFDNCSDEEMKIITQLYRKYPNGYLLPSENMAVSKLKTQMAIKRVGSLGIQDYDGYDNLRTMFPYALQPWVKEWLDKNKKRLKKNI